MNAEASKLRILAVVPAGARREIARGLAPLQAELCFVRYPSEAAAAADQNDVFHVALVSAVPSDFDWWALGGMLSLLNPRPALLVYARGANFELWAGVLDSGGYDVIPEPFSEYELQDAVLRAARSFQERLRHGSPGE